MRRIAIVVPLLVLLAGCSANESGGSAATGAKAAAPAGLVDARAGDTQAQPAVAVAKLAAVPRSLIRRAQLDVRVRDVSKAATDAQQVVEGAGGELSDEQLDLHSTHPTASLQLRVPPARLDSILTKLSGLGDEQSRRLGTDDVTEQVVDLNSRLATQSASVKRVRGLLDRANNLTEVVHIEAELSRREADLESLQARVRALSGQVAMAEVTLSLTTRPAPSHAATTAIGFTSGLTGGWRAFTTAVRVGAAAVGALLPFLPVLVAAAWAALWWRRRTAAV